MAKRYFTAVLGDHTFLRSSDTRAYSHMVVARPSFASAIASAKRGSGCEASNFDYYQRVIAGTSRYTHSEDEVARAHDEVAGCADAQAYVQKKIDQAVAAVEGREATGYFDRFQDAGWASRLDLAEKNRARHSDGYWEEARVLEAVEVDAATYRALKSAEK